MIYEIREYTTVPGRMPALVQRFTDHTLRIFERHSMECTLLTTTEFGANSTNGPHVMRDSYEDMAAKWAAFRVDEEWQEVRAASEADGPIVASISRRVLKALL